MPPQPPLWPLPGRGLISRIRSTCSDEQERTNEIRMAIPLLQTIGIAGKDVSVDALLTQLVQELKAHCKLATYAGILDRSARAPGWFH